MSLGVTLITPTGGRPESLRRCALFVKRQTWTGPLQWIIVDDGEPASHVSADMIDVKRIYPEPSWRPGQNTLARNLLAALPKVKHDVVLFFEDDDYYAPDYVEEQVKQMGGALMVGEAPARYYHLPTQRFWVLSNKYHASLCQTGVRRSVLPLLLRICEENGSAFIDVQLWRSCAGEKILHDGGRSVGMKGLAGRAGIGAGHRPNGTGWRQDANFTILKSWIGEYDVQLYHKEKT